MKIPNFKAKLRRYQKEGVCFIENRDGRVLLADEMGLGKTIQTLAWLQLHPELRPVIVVCPASLKLNWEREIKTQTEKQDIVILNGNNPTGRFPLFRKAIYIINYDIVKAWEKNLKKLKAKVLVLDECHAIKNRRAIRTKAIKRIAKEIDHIICLSGTPIINRPVEIYNSISLINPELFPSFFKYAKEYCGATHNGFGWDFSGATHTDNLHKKLVGSVMLRRLKKDVLKELPEKTRTVIPMELDNPEEYKIVAKDFIKWLKEQDPDKAERAERAETLTRIEILKQVAIKNKMKSCIDWIKQYLETENKLVVFATHKQTTQAIISAFPEISVRLEGGMDGNEKQKSVDRFQNDKRTRLFVGNIKAAGVGLTLTASSNTCFVELGWTPGEHDQAEDRVHRIGQEADSVNAYYLIADGTIENQIIELLDKKRKVLADVLDGRTLLEDSSMLNSLLKTLII